MPKKNNSKNRQEKPFIREVRLGRQQWIDFLRFWLVDIYVRPDDDYSPFRFINRVSFMNLRHLVVLIFHDRKAEENPITVDELISAFDPHFKVELYDQMTSKPLEFGKRIELGNGRKAFELYETVKPYQIQLFDTKSYILLFDVILNRQTQDGRILPGQVPSLKFQPLKNDTNRWRFFNEVFKDFDGLGSRMELEYNLENHFERLRHKTKFHEAPSGKQKYRLLKKDHKLIIDAMDEMIDVIDGEYGRLSKSPLLKSFIKEDDFNKTAPSNLLFVSKLFNRNEHRFKNNYHYNPFFMMRKQARDIERQLLKMGGHSLIKESSFEGALENLKDHKFILFNGERETLKREDFIPYPDENYDNVFWEWLKDKKQISKIVANINNGWPDYMRLFPENNLMSGATTIIQNPFNNGSLGWIDDTNLTKEELASAHMKLVGLHYILQLGSPKVPVEAKNLTLVLNSIRVNGAVWMSACYLRENKEYKVDGFNTGLLHQEGFEASLSIQNSLIRETERRIRKKSQRRYIKSLSKVINDVILDEVSEEKSQDQDAFLDENDVIFELTPKILDKVNKQTEILTRIYPYDHVSLMPDDEYQADDNSQEKREFSTENFCFGFYRNPYFSRLNRDGYMNDSQIVDKLMDQIKLRLLEASKK